MKIIFSQIGNWEDGASREDPTSPPGLFFRHAGHRYAFSVQLFYTILYAWFQFSFASISLMCLEMLLIDF